MQLNEGSSRLHPQSGSINPEVGLCLQFLHTQVSTLSSSLGASVCMSTKMAAVLRCQPEINSLRYLLKTATALTQRMIDITKELNPTVPILQKRIPFSAP